ncbi:hypothetical protein BDV12DRAFT_81370 [Aspergillus spectabilis]
MPPGLGKAIGDPNSDDYVAQVLAKEARDSSMKYSALGMNAYMPSRPTGSAPKPNTRFLRHIIKETDNHNTALKKKEEKEARERMRQQRDPAQSQNAGKDQGQHRLHDRDRDSRRDRREDREDRHRSRRRRQRSRSASMPRERTRATRRRSESRDRDGDRHRRSRKSHRHRSYSRSRTCSPYARDVGSRSRRRHRRRSSSRSCSHSRSRSRSPESKARRKDKQVTRQSASSRIAPAFHGKASGDESDPLEDLVGPLPKEDAPVRSRGRGAYKPNASNIDAHFAPEYDPTLDVQLEDDEAQTSNRSARRPVAGLMTGDDDWELSLEALRDRARWKQRGEDRLREAGFNDDIVERWKNSASMATGNDEGTSENVKWSTKSEGREWDRGKYVDKDGHIDVKALW